MRSSISQTTDRRLLQTTFPRSLPNWFLLGSTNGRQWLKTGGEKPGFVFLPRFGSRGIFISVYSNSVVAAPTNHAFLSSPSFHFAAHSMTPAPARWALLHIARFLLVTSCAASQTEPPPSFQLLSKELRAWALVTLAPSIVPAAPVMVASSCIW